MFKIGNVIYSLIASNKIGKRDVAPTSIISSDGALLTQNSIKIIYLITGFPTDYSAMTLYLLRDKFQGSGKINTVMFGVPSKQKCDQKLMKAYRSAEKRYNEINYEYTQMSEGDRLIGKNVKMVGGYKTFINRDIHTAAKEKMEALKVMIEDLERDGYLSEVVYSIELVTDFDNYKNDMRNLTKLLSNKGFQYTRVYDGEQYMKSISPSANFDKNLGTPVLLSVPNLAEQMPLHESIYPYENQLYFGLTYGTTTPIIKDAVGVNEAFNFLIAGATGSGKTTTTLSVITDFLYMDSTACVVDYKGKEYYDLCKNIGGKYLEFSESDFQCINFLALKGLTESRARYMLKCFYTQIGILTGLSLQELDRCTEYLSDVTHSYLSNRGVSFKNPGTYKDLNFVDWYAFAKSFQRNEDSEELALKIKEMLTTLSRFAGSGGDAYLMGSYINLWELLKNNLIVVSFSKNTNDKNQIIEDSLRYLYVEVINDLKAEMQREKKLLHVCVFEEVARAWVNEHFQRSVSSIATGGRSSHKVLMLCTNSFSFMKQSNGLLDTIVSNLTLYYIGKMNANDIEILHSMVKSQEMYEELMDISENSSENQRHFCFYDRPNNIVTKAKFWLSRDIVGSDIFVTKNL